MGSTFGKYLRMKRKEKDFTLKGLAEATGLSDAYLCQIENGKRKIPSTDVVNKLATALKVDFFEMMVKADKFMKYKDLMKQTGGIVGKKYLPDGTMVITKLAAIELTNIHNYPDVMYKKRKLTIEEIERLKYILPAIFPE